MTILATLVMILDQMNTHNYDNESSSKCQKMDYVSWY